MSGLKIATSATDASYLIGGQVTARLFGVNFLSGYETADGAANGETYDDVLLAVSGVLRDGATLSTDGVAGTVSSMRFPGGTLTENFFKAVVDPQATGWQPKNALTIDTPFGVASGTDRPTSVRDFLNICHTYGGEMTFVMPTLRYFVDGAPMWNATTAKEVADFVTAMLSEAFDKGVTIRAIELGNEWWGQGITASQYGEIASNLAATVQSAETAFYNAKLAGSVDMSGWHSPDILVQIGTRANDDIESRDILAQFNTLAEREAVDGFVTHRYVTAGFAEINDAWVRNSIYTFDSLGGQLTGTGWKPLNDMISRVSEWNILDGGADTGLKAYSTIVAIVGELAHFGIDTADIWSAEDRNSFSLTRHTAGSTEGDVYLGLSFVGEAFRMMKESLPGKTWMELYSKPADNNPANYSWHGDSVAGFNQFDTDALGVEAFSGDHEVVLFVSNRTETTNAVDLDLAGMIGSNYSAWATRVGAASGSDPVSNFGVPIVTNLSGDNFLVGGLMPGTITLAAWETLRITITIGAFGQTILGYNDADALFGGKYGDLIDGRDGDDVLQGNGGADTIFGNFGNDRVDGGIADDVLSGGIGKDSVFGGDGADTVQGGLGDDSMAGGLGVDTLIFVGSLAVSVNLTVTTAQTTGYGSDIIVEFENVQSGTGNDSITGGATANLLQSIAGDDTLAGGGGADSLFSDVGNDVLYGGGGTDNLYGGTGMDVLYGGANIDAFWFAADDGQDVIKDFQDGIDKIHFSSPGVSFASLQFATVTGGVRVTYDVGDFVTVLNVTQSQLTVADFIFG